MFIVFFRVAPIVISLGFGAYVLLAGRKSGIILIAAGLALLWCHFRFGTVWMSFKALKIGEIDRAKMWIDYIAYPQFLSNQHRSYYHWIKGAIHASRENLDEAEEHLLAAMNGSLRTSNDRSVVAACLADLSLKRGDKESTLKYLEQAKEEQHGEGAETLIRKIETVINEEN